MTGCLIGTIKPEEIDEYRKIFFDNIVPMFSDMPITDFLGLYPSEYTLWETGKKTMADIVKDRKDGISNPKPKKKWSGKGKKY